MAENYKVGNLQIAFEAVNETSKAFEDLAKNLNAIKKAISTLGSLGGSDLERFGANLDSIRGKFSPLLADISSVGSALTSLNELIGELGLTGVKSLKDVANAFKRLNEETENGATAVTDVVGLVKRDVRVLNQTVPPVLNELNALNLKLLEQKQRLSVLRSAYAKAFKANEVEKVARYGQEILRVTEEITSLKDQIKNLNETPIRIQTEQPVGGQFSQAQKALAEIKQQMIDYAYKTGEIDQQLFTQANNMSIRLNYVAQKVEEAFKTPLEIAQSDLADFKKQLVELYYNNEKDIGLAQQITELEKKINGANEAAKKATMTTQELTIYEYQQAQAAKQQEIEFLKASLAMGTAGEKTKEYRKKLAELTEEQNKNSNATKKGSNGFKKFLKSLGRIALYRTIRRAIQMITQAFQETIQTFAQVDDGVNETMSNITSSLSVIKLSFGSMVLPLLQMVEPIIQQISVAFANFANLVGQAMSTTGKYTKINAEYWADYREQLEQTQGSLLDFDKVRALNNTTTPSLSDALITEEDVDETDENVQRIQKALGTLRSIIEKVFSILQKIGPPALDTLLSIGEDVLDFIDKIVTGVSKVIDKLDEMGLLEPLVYGVIGAIIGLGAYNVISSISKLTGAFGKLSGSLTVIAAVATLAYAVISNWGEMNAIQKAASVIGLLTVAIFGLALAMGAFHSAWSIGVAAVAIVGGIAAIVASITAAKKDAAQPISAYANGGLPDKGSVFLAGEAGAELVYNTPSGQSGVANVSQLKAAFYQALVEWGNSNSNNINVTVNLDGKKIYSGITSDANRRGNAWSGYGG